MQDDVYQHVRPIIRGFLRGFNGTVFAYGQTSSGKTFTMQGPRDQPGIIPRALAELFAFVAACPSECHVTLSYLELYNEELIDLLSSDPNAPPLQIRDVAALDPSGRPSTADGSSNAQSKRHGDSGNNGPASAVHVEGLREVAVRAWADAAAALAEGEARRHVAATMMNRHSSRSHTILRLGLSVRDGQAGVFRVSQLRQASALF